MVSDATYNSQRIAQILFEDGTPELEQDECDSLSKVLDQKHVFAPYWIDTVEEFQRHGGYRIGIDENGNHWVSRVVGFSQAESFKPHLVWINSNGHGQLASSQLLATHGGLTIIFEYKARPGQKVEPYKVWAG
jgi:hypothetical protein